MSLDATFVVFALFVFAATTTQTLTGFGGTIVALTLGAYLYPIKALLPILVPLNLLVTTYVIARYARHADLRLLVLRILPPMALGIALGLALFQMVHGALLKRVYGGVVALFALREVYLQVRRRGAWRPPLSAAQASPWLLAAGVIHGIYASGGPLLVYALGRSRLDKARFRATLCALWIVTNTAMTAVYLAGGRLSGAQVPALTALVPVVVLAIVAGEQAHSRVAEARFRLVVQVVLLMAGLAILTQG